MCVCLYECVCICVYVRVCVHAFMEVYSFLPLCGSQGLNTGGRLWQQTPFLVSHLTGPRNHLLGLQFWRLRSEMEWSPLIWASSEGIQMTTAGVCQNTQSHVILWEKEEPHSGPGDLLLCSISPKSTAPHILLPETRIVPASKRRKN